MKILKSIAKFFVVCGEVLEEYRNGKYSKIHKR
jgi:hypothetical protein